MKKIIPILLFVSFLGFGIFISCNDKATSDNQPAQTMLAGTLTIQADNTVQPIVEDVLAVFQSVYAGAKITQVNRNEGDIVKALLNDSASVAVLTRTLTEGEEAHFAKVGIKPRTTLFATDGLAFVASRTAKDTVLSIDDIYRIMKGEEPSSPKQLVFDSANSSTVSYLMAKTGVDKIPLKNVYALKNTEEVLTFVSKNPNSIGFIGVNWLVQTPENMRQLVENIRVLGVNNVKGKAGATQYYKPSQSNIAAGLYPFSRTVYVLNYQGKRALGTGFANYISAPEGQRIILKSGLVPVTMPSREIEVK